MYKFLIKALKKKVLKPGSRGGKYWIDRKGNIRYDIKGIKRPKAMDMATKMFEDNIRYYVGMAKIVANRIGLPIRYDEGQPIGDFADLIASCRHGAIIGYLEYFKKRPTTINLREFVKRRASGQMMTVASKLSSLLNLTSVDKRHIAKIRSYIDDYFKKNGVSPTVKNIAENIELHKYLKEGKVLIDKKVTVEIIERLKDYVIKRMSWNVEELGGGEPIEEKLNLPGIEDMMKKIHQLKKRGEITNIGYKIMQMYLGIGKGKKPLRWSEIGKILGLDRRTVYGHFRKNADVLKPYFEKYQGLLEKSLLTDKVTLFLKKIFDI